MSPRSTARTGLLAAVLLLATLPLAAAQVPSISPASTSPPAVTPPATTLPATGDDFMIEEGPLTFVGAPNNPDFIAIQAADGSTALAYAVDADGRARLDVAGENAVTDATFVRIEGDPTGDAFRLVIRDAQGEDHAVDVDRRALAAVTSNLPPAEAPVEITRPPSWPGAPQQSYLLYVEDAARNHVSAAQLNGDAYLQKGGVHRAVLQIPLDENQWDRWFLTARRDSQSAAMNATFGESHTTGDALVLAADYAPSLLNAADGERVSFGVTYERRLSPLVVQRFTDSATYKFRVDGAGPTVHINVPATSSDFRFTVAWSGSDATSGMGLFVAHYRETGTTQWTHWMSSRENGGVFSGAWGKTYDFRVRSFDAVGNPSATDATGTVAVIAKPGETDDVNDPPSARLLTPAVGAQVSGLVPITWTASDPDNTRLNVRLELSDDEGETWRLLYAGSGSETRWDTTSDADGPGYKIRLTVSDGTQSVSDVVPALTVRNIIAFDTPSSSGGQTPAVPTSAPLPPGGTSSQPGATSGGDEPVTPAADDNGDEDGGKDTPLGIGVLLAALGVAAIVVRRRRG